MSAPSRWSQCRRPAGAPLYPVAKMRLSLTMTAPTDLRLQVEREATARAMLTKYSSQLGRNADGGSRIIVIPYPRSRHPELRSKIVHAAAQRVDARTA